MLILVGAYFWCGFAFEHWVRKGGRIPDYNDLLGTSREDHREYNLPSTRTTAVTLSAIYPSERGFVQDNQTEMATSTTTLSEKFKFLLESEGASVVAFTGKDDTVQQILKYLDGYQHGQLGLLLGGAFSDDG